MRDYPIVILESPFKPKADGTYASEAEKEAVLERDLAMNKRYARAAMRDALKNHGEAPSASHLLYTQEGVLDDNDPEERAMGIDAGLAFRKAAVRSAVYLDRGISGGMIYGIKAAIADGKPVVGRYLDPKIIAELGIETVPVNPAQIAELGIVLEQTKAAA